MGRPKKEIDEGVMFHMLKNNAPVSLVAKHLGIHRDTLYSRYAVVIREGREAHKEAWKEIIIPWIEEQMQKRREILKAKEATKRVKRRYRKNQKYRRRVNF